MLSTLSRGAIAALLALALDAATAYAQWSADPAVNTAVSRLASYEQFPRAVADGDDGVIVVWQTLETGAYGYDLRASRLDALGFPLWTVDVSTALHDQRDHQAIPDGAGGVIVTWSDERGGSSIVSDIYAQRVDAAGTRRWGADGTPVCLAASIQAYPQIAPDGEGGAVIAWRDSRSYGATGVDVYAQRLNAAGVPQWTADGVLVCGATGNQLDPGVASVPGEGAIVAWSDERLGSTNADVFAQKLNGAGVPQWTADGVGVAYPATQRWYNDVNPVLADGSGGACVVFEDDYYTAADIDLHVVRFASDGTLPWGGSRTICSATGIQRMAQPVVDGSGVVAVPWIDYRYGTGDPDIYAQRFDASGSMSWATNGLSIAGTTAVEADPVVVRERGGSYCFAWTDNRGGDPDIFARRFDATGTPIWPFAVDVCTAGNQQVDVVAVPSGNCGAVFAWRDDRWNGALPPDDTSSDVYAQRVWCDGTLLQRTIVLDAPNGGEVWQGHTYHLLEYHGLDVEGRDVALEYTTDLGAHWTPITTVLNSGAHHAYDWNVPNTPSTQCVVRARVLADPPADDASDAVFTIVLDPAAGEPGGVPARLTLAAPRPNPASGSLTVTFGLPGDGTATVQVFDASGRLVRTLHDGPAGAGWHRVRWDGGAASGGRARPGLYWVLLRAEGQARSERVAWIE